MLDVPCSTLKDSISGHVTQGTKPGPSPYLSVTEEDELENYVAEASQIGIGKTCRQTMNMVQTLF